MQVSCLTTTYNRGIWIPLAIHCFLNQTFTADLNIVMVLVIECARTSLFPMQKSLTVDSFLSLKANVLIGRCKSPNLFPGYDYLPVCEVSHPELRLTTPRPSNTKNRSQSETA